MTGGTLVHGFDIATQCRAEAARLARAGSDPGQDKLAAAGYGSTSPIVMTSVPGVSPGLCGLMRN